jgi:dTDP-4-amino-4,6-dideoxygalactose transaminase
MTTMAGRLNQVFRNGGVARLMEFISFHHVWFSLAAHCFLFTASYLLAFIIMDPLFRPEFTARTAEGTFLRTVVLMVAVRAVVFKYHDLYEGRWVYVSMADLLNIIRSSIIGTLLFALVGVFWEPLRVPQRVLFLDMVFCIAMVSSARLIFRVSYARVNKAAVAGAPQVLLAGPIGKIRTVTEEIIADPLAFYKPIGIIDTSDSKKNPRLRISDLPVFTVQEAVSEKHRFKEVHHIVLCWPSSTQAELDRVVEMVRPLGIPFKVFPYFDEVLNPDANDFQSDSASAERIAPVARSRGKSHQRIFLSPPHMVGLEQEYVRRAFQSNYIAPLGPMVDSFEQAAAAMTGASYTLALSSGTAAIHLALKVIGIEHGDTVITSTLTFIGGVTPIVYQRATPIFIDCDRETWNMDTKLLARTLEEYAASGRLPKAVVPTDLYGQCADYDEINRICQPYGLPVIVDAAEAVGATYRGRHAGTMTTAGIYSFNGNKIITTSGGGMLVSSDKEFIEQARFLAQQARDPFPHYEHSSIGYNYRMSNILAGVGLAQLRALPERVKRRREIFDYYRNALGDVPGIEFMPEAPYGRCNRWLTVILITPEVFGADRETVRLALEAENIESRPVWKPMHLQPVFNPQISPVESPSGAAARHSTGQAQINADYKNKPSTDLTDDTDGKKPVSEQEMTPNRNVSGGLIDCRVVGGQVSEDFFRRGLCLPSGTAMTADQLARVVSIILKSRK